MANTDGHSDDFDLTQYTPEERATLEELIPLLDAAREIIRRRLEGRDGDEKREGGGDTTPSA